MVELGCWLITWILAISQSRSSNLNLSVCKALHIALLGIHFGNCPKNSAIARLLLASCHLPPLGRLPTTKIQAMIKNQPSTSLDI